VLIVVSLFNVNTPTFGDFSLFTVSHTVKRKGAWRNLLGFFTLSHRQNHL